MSRVQLALNVSDIDEAVGFYSKLFGVEPAKRRPGYANFAIADPPLKLVLIENDGRPWRRGDRSAQPSRSGGGDHRGGRGGHGRLSDEGLEPAVEESTTCCYAVQDKVWVTDPDGAPWEVYTVLADAPAETGIAGDGRCCSLRQVGEIQSRGRRAVQAAACC